MKEGQCRQRYIMNKNLEVRTNLRGIINSIVVKAKGVRVRDSVKSFLTSIKDLNYIYLCLLYGFMCSSSPL